MLMPVVYSESETTHSDARIKDVCPSCGDAAIIIRRTFDIPVIRNHTMPQFRFAALTRDSKCVYCYL